MARLVHDREVTERARAASRETVPKSVGVETEEEPSPAVTTALERLTAFIPTEVVAGWGAAMGMLAPRTALESWAVFAGAVVFLVVLVLLETGIRAKQSSSPADSRRRGLLLAVAVVAFTVWAFASPGSPAAAQWGDAATRYFGVLAIAMSAILFRLAQLLGLAPVESPGT
jgi:hypothetical protein